MATVVGNLVDNADRRRRRRPECLPRGSAPARTSTAGRRRNQWVEVEIRQDASSVEIVGPRLGPGMPPEVAQEVFAHGFTTKAAEAGERGIGLALTRLVCQRRGGEVRSRRTPRAARCSSRELSDRAACPRQGR